MIGLRVGLNVGLKVGVAAGASANEIGSSDTIHIALTGQSNADRRADEDAFTVRFGYDAVFPNVQYTRRAAPSIADPPVFVDESGSVAPSAHATENIGVEQSMARYLNDVLPGRFKLHFWSIAASSLHVHRKTGATYPTVGPNAHALMKASFLSRMPRMDALVHIDGESDAGGAASAATYEANLTSVIASMRTTFGAGLPIVISELADTHAYSDQATVIAAQAAVDAAVTGVSLVSNAGRALNGPDHYTADSFILLGEALADAVLAALGYSRVRWTSVSADRQITFTYAGTGAAAASYLWSFGDGTTSTNQNPVRTYTANGNYTVRLDVTSTTGKVTSYSTTVAAVLPTWAVDATSLKGVPISAPQWAAAVTAASLAMGSPDHLYLLQEGSGNPVDTISGKTLTAGNTPGYSQVVAGWTRVFVGATGDAATESFVNATMPNANANSVLFFGYMTWNASGSANRALASYGGAAINEIESSAGTAKARVRAGTPAGPTLADHAAAVHAYALMYNRAAGRIVLYTDLEIKEIVYGAQAGADFRITCGLSTDVAANNQHGYWTVWTGADAERSDAAIRALFQCMGWNVSW